MENVTRDFWELAGIDRPNEAAAEITADGKFYAFGIGRIWIELESAG